MLLFSTPQRILAYREAIDMHKSFDGLIGAVQSRLGENPLSSALFVFINRRGSYLKLLLGIASTCRGSNLPRPLDADRLDSSDRRSARADLSGIVDLGPAKPCDCDRRNADQSRPAKLGKDE